jgi:hypothetical protein
VSGGSTCAAPEENLGAKRSHDLIEVQHDPFVPPARIAEDHLTGQAAPASIVSECQAGQGTGSVLGAEHLANFLVLISRRWTGGFTVSYFVNRPFHPGRGIWAASAATRGQSADGTIVRPTRYSREGHFERQPP